MMKGNSIIIAIWVNTTKIFNSLTREMSLKTTKWDYRVCSLISLELSFKVNFSESFQIEVIVFSDWDKGPKVYLNNSLRQESYLDEFCLTLGFYGEDSIFVNLQAIFLYSLSSSL